MERKAGGDATYVRRNDVGSLHAHVIQRGAHGASTDGAGVAACDRHDDGMYVGISHQ